jgi:hypothetical protein
LAASIDTDGRVSETRHDRWPENTVMGLPPRYANAWLRHQSCERIAATALGRDEQQFAV